MYHSNLQPHLKCQPTNTQHIQIQFTPQSLLLPPYPLTLTPSLTVSVNADPRLVLRRGWA
jgi:hypothetical protein